VAESRVRRFDAGGLVLQGVERDGRGTAVLLLHGFTGSHESMADLAERLAPRPTLCLDLVGHGGSDAPEDPAAWHMDACVAQVERVLDAWASGPVHVVGYSMGGRVALSLAAAAPQRVASLALVGASPGLASEAERAQRRAADAALADELRADGLEAFVERWTAQPLFASQKRLPEAVRERARAERLRNRPEALARSLRGMGTGSMPPLHDALPSLDVPVTVVVGDEDARFRALAESMAAALPRARVARIPEAGHAAHLERPDATAAEIRRGLAESETGVGSEPGAEAEVAATGGAGAEARAEARAEAAATARPSPLVAWWAAARPRTLLAAVGPVAVGTAAAQAAGRARAGPALAALLGALLLQLISNFANDLFDFEKGVDTPERVGPTRATQAGWLTPAQMRRGIAAAILAAVAVGIYLAAVGGWPVVAIGIASIAAALAYTGGPRPFGYHGLGDPAVFLFFGVVAVVGTEYVQSLRLSGLALAASVPVGALATAILVVNNLRDIDTDARAGKRTLAVRLGRRGTRLEYQALLGLAYGGVALLPLAGAGGPALWLPWASLPLALRLRRVVLESEGARLDEALAGTARLGLVFSLALAVGILL